MPTPLPAASRPCRECPFRTGTEPGQFPASRYDQLRDTVSGDMRAPIFACHMSVEGKDFACAGWLAVEGHASIPIRLAVMTGRLDPARLDPGEGWPELFQSYEAMAEVQAVSD